MKTRTRALLPLVVLGPLVLANDRPAEKPSFKPKQGTTLVKRVAIVSELELDDMTMEMNGQDVSEQAAQIEIALKVTMDLAVTDHYEALADERPTRLKRSFDEISSVTHVSGSNPLQPAEDKDIPLESELEGSTVVFAWDEAESAYTVTFDGGQGDEDLLDALEENLDLRGFLPAGEVAEGDTWEIPAEAVKAALAPGGDIKLRPEGESDPMSGMNQFSQNDIIGDLDGEFTAVYGGTRKEDGKSVAVIQLKIEAKSARDMSEQLDEMMEKMKESEGLPPGLEMEISALDTEYEIDAEGELVWDLEAGLVHALTLSGEVRMIVDMSMSMKMGDNDMAMEISQTYAGTTTITLATGEE